MTVVHIPELGGDRRSGRTTRMIQAAIQMMHQGKKVLIFGTDVSGVDYLRHLFQDSWVVDSVRINVDTRNIVELENGGSARFSSLSRNPRGIRFDDVFIDHHALETQPEDVHRVVEFFEVRTQVKKPDGPTMWEILMVEDD